MNRPTSRPGDGPPGGPPRLAADLDPVAARLRAADGLALLSDFDGTLAPVVPRPEAAELPARARRRLAALAAAPSVAVGVVSGRAAADVRDRVGVDGLRYVGNHGLERTCGGEVEALASAADVAAVEAVCDRLDARLAAVDGARVERKGPTATVHYRRVPADAVGQVEAAVREAADGCDRVRAFDGKAVLELRPADGPDKGEAVAALYEDCVPAGERWLPAYLGDDAGDEPAFEAVRERDGVAVRVGPAGDVAATHVVDDPDAVCAFLGWLVDQVRTSASAAGETE